MRWNDRWIVGILCTVVTAYFLVQRAEFLSWDYAAYKLNAQYWFADGQYFEPYRPPLVPLLLGAFGLFGWVAADYLFIVAVSALFLYATVLLARELRVEPLPFYALLLTPFLFLNGTFHGTELLAMALLMLALVGIARDVSWSGAFIGLAALARYSWLAVFPLLLFHRRRWAQALLAFGLTLLPWLLFNRLAYGDALLSIADQYAMNVAMRTDVVQPFDPASLLIVLGALLPLSLVGIFAIARRGPWTWEAHRMHLALLFLAGYALWQFAGTPFKLPRYLFITTLPAAYFSYHGIMTIVGWVAPKTVRSTALLLGTLSIFVLSLTLVAFSSGVEDNAYETRAVYDRVRTALDGRECRIASDGWVLLTGRGVLAEPPPREEQSLRYRDEGYLIVDFAHIPDHLGAPGIPVLLQGEGFTVYGNGCAAPVPYAQTYLQRQGTYLREVHGEALQDDPCGLLVGQILAGACRTVQLK